MKLGSEKAMSSQVKHGEELLQIAGAPKAAFKLRAALNEATNIEGHPDNATWIIGRVQSDGVSPST